MTTRSYDMVWVRLVLEGGSNLVEPSLIFRLQPKRVGPKIDLLPLLINPLDRVAVLTHSHFSEVFRFPQIGKDPHASDRRTQVYDTLISIVPDKLQDALNYWFCGHDPRQELCHGIFPG